MDNNVMEVISPSFATFATPQSPEFIKLMAKVASLKKQISNLQATPRSRNNNGSNRRTQFRSPSLDTSRQQTGKRSSQQLEATSAPGPTHSRLFYITNRASGLKILIDTCAKVSVVPRSHTHWKTQKVQAWKPLTILQFQRKALAR